MIEEPTQVPVPNEPLPAPAPPSEVQSVKLPTGFALIKESITQYKQHFATLIGLAGIYTGVSYGFTFLMLGVVMLGGFGFILFGVGFNASESMVALALGVVLFLLILTAAIWFITWTMIALMKNVLSKDIPLGVHESFAQAKPLVWPFLVTSFWSGLASCGVVAIAFLLMMVLVVPFAMIENRVLLGIGLVVGLSILLASVIVANTWFIFAQWLVIDGKAQGRAAVAHSKELMKGIFGSILGRYLIISFAYAIPLIIISLICEFAIPVIGPYISQAIGILIFFPVLLIVMARFYQTLIKRSAGAPRVESISTRDVTILSGVGLVSLFLFVFISVFALMSISPEVLSAFKEEYRKALQESEKPGEFMIETESSDEATDTSLEI